MSKALVKQQPKFSAMINTTGYQQMIASTLRDPDRQKRFVASITSAVANTPALATCNPATILAGGLLGEGLNLSPSPQLGQYYLVPFKCKVKGPDGKVIQQNGQDLVEYKAQFVLGYKGYVQLAERSGQYKHLNVVELKEGEFHGFNRLNEELIDYVPIDDFDVWENADTVAYYAFFEYMNGFQKAICWTKDQMLSHADRYSKAFSRQAYQKILNHEIPDRDIWKYSSFWYKDFDRMAEKTMLRHLISRWGIMSTEMQMAFSHDNSFADINEDNGDVVVHVEEEVDIEPPDDSEPVQPDVPEEKKVGEISLADL